MKKKSIIVIKSLLLLIVLWYVTIALLKAIHQIKYDDITIRWIFVVTGIAIFIGSTLISSLIYKYLYKQLGANISLKQAFVLFSVPSVGKYLPGKAIAIAGHASIAKYFNVSMLTSTAIIFFITIIGLSVTSIAGLSLFFFEIIFKLNAALKFLLLSFVVITVIIIICPKIYWRSINLIFRFFGKPILKFDFPFHKAITFAISILFQNVLYLASISIITLGIVKLPITTLPAFIGAACLGSVIGYIAIFAPAGIGVREGILLLLLTPLLGEVNAGIVTIFSRFIQTVLDVILFVIGMLWLHMIRNNLSKVNSPSSGGDSH